MSYKDLVICCGEGTTAGANGELTVANSNIAAGDIALATITVAGAAVAKVQATTAAGSLLLKLRAEDGSAVNAAFVVNYVVLRPSACGFVSA